MSDRKQVLKALDSYVRFCKRQRQRRKKDFDGRTARLETLVRVYNRWQGITD